MVFSEDGAKVRRAIGNRNRFVSQSTASMIPRNDDTVNLTCPGAGVGGLNLAARLAKAGIHVTIVEKNDHVGGRCSIIEHDGHVS